MVGGIAGWMFKLWRGPSDALGMSTAAALGWPLPRLAIMLYTWWHIVTSRTTLTAEELHQGWVWDKNMELGELAYGKLIRVRGLDWLIAPRLYVRTLLGKFAVFYAADPAMLAEFERLVAELKAFRGFNRNRKPDWRGLPMTDPGGIAHGLRVCRRPRASAPA